MVAMSLVATSMVNPMGVIVEETIDMLHIVDTPIIAFLASTFLSIESLEKFLLKTISTI